MVIVAVEVVFEAGALEVEGIREAFRIMTVDNVYRI